MENWERKWRDTFYQVRLERLAAEAIRRAQLPEEEQVRLAEEEAESEKGEFFHYEWNRQEHKEGMHDEEPNPECDWCRRLAEREP